MTIFIHISQTKQNSKSHDYRIVVFNTITDIKQVNNYYIILASTVCSVYCPLSRCDSDIFIPKCHVGTFHRFNISTSACICRKTEMLGEHDTINRDWRREYCVWLQNPQFVIQQSKNGGLRLHRFKFQVKGKEQERNWKFMNAKNQTRLWLIERMN